MNEYRFGGSRFKRIIGRLIGSIAWSGCGVSQFFVKAARWANSTAVWLRIRANQLVKESAPITIHITRIVPLDRWTLRIEFTVDRKTKYCVHHNSAIGGYGDLFAKFKRSDEIQTIEAHYHMVSNNISKWKKI